MLKIIILLIAAVVFGYYAYITFDDAFRADRENALMCIEETKLCTGGSVVGRMSVHCEVFGCISNIWL